MRKTLLVMRHEVITSVMRRSFLFTAVGIPIISALIFLGISALNRNAPDAVSTLFTSPGQGSSVIEGFIDSSGLIRSIPPSVQPGTLQKYPDEAAALQALNAGKISAYYLIPQDYLQTGRITYVRPDFNPLSSGARSELMQWVLQVNLLDGDVQLANRINQPLNLQVTLLEPQQRDKNNPLTFFLPYGVTMVFYIVILMSASFLLSSVTKEKENRMVEILMSSITPRQMLTGKIIGLGLVGLVQTVFWVGTGYALLRLSGRTFDLPASFQLPPSFLAWGLVFFLLGYAVYASLMAAVGALVPNLREASQATFVVILPMIIPLMLISILIDEPHGPLAVGLSLFPLTAPVTMMTRLSATDVPLWQPILSAILLAATAVWIVRAVAGLFRAQTLLSGQPFDIRRLFNALAGRAS